MRFARWTFLIAGIYGLLALVPMYFMEEQVGIDTPPAITHPEFFYGFVGVAVAFQLVFLIISADPSKYRLFMLAAIVEKFSFAIAAGFLLMQGRLAGMIILGAGIDLALGVLFFLAWFRIGTQGESEVSASKLRTES
jgi:hypothetical protein